MKLTLSSESVLRWLFVMTVIGYPVAGMIAVVMNLESRQTSIPFRLLVVFVSLLGLLLAVVLRARFKPPVPLMAFLALYLARLLWDWGGGELPDVTTTLAYFIGTSLIPMVAVLALAPQWDDRKITWTLVVCGTAICLAVIILDSTGMAAARSMTQQSGGRLSFDTLNAITIGHIGVTTLLASLSAMIVTRKWLLRCALAVAMLIALVCLLMSGSRGPIVSLVVALGVFVIARRKWAWLAAGLAVLALLAMTTRVGDLIQSLRLEGIGTDESSTERLVSQQNSIAEFLSHPFIGSTYVDPITLEYPHNFFIETAMALGLVGLLLLVPLVLVGCWRSVLLMRSGIYVLPLIFWQFVMAGQFSGALWGDAVLFVCLALIIAAKPKPKPAKAHDEGQNALAPDAFQGVSAMNLPNKQWQDPRAFRQ